MLSQQISNEEPFEQTLTNHYKLSCPVCANIFDDNGYQLECTTQHKPALLFTQYITRLFEPMDQVKGIFRYQKWLPMHQKLSCPGRTHVYQSQQLIRITGLPHLWIAFNGYWPEKDIFFETGTFKELEAYAVLARLPRYTMAQKKTLVVSSAGNTAAAFATVCSRLHIPCLIVIPESGLQAMHFSAPLDSCVKIIALLDADYADAIGFANAIARNEGFIAEGGAKNVARIDGLGTVLLSAVEVMNRLPDYYFQAIGSGSGAIAVHNAARRLIQDGRFGTNYPRLMLSQNFPFTPIYSSWQTRKKNLLPLDKHEGKQQIRNIAAKVLSNQHPPYSLIGGVFDALTESHGDMLMADNQATMQAMQLFQEVENIDINPAAGVAFATLLKAVQDGRINKDASILLNITGGGWERKGAEQQLIAAQPNLCIHETDITTSRALEQAIDICR